MALGPGKLGVDTPALGWKLLACPTWPPPAPAAGEHPRVPTAGPSEGARKRRPPSGARARENGKVRGREMGLGARGESWEVDRGWGVMVKEGTWEKICGQLVSAIVLHESGCSALTLLFSVVRRLPLPLVVQCCHWLLPLWGPITPIAIPFTSAGVASSGTTQSM